VRSKSHAVFRSINVCHDTIYVDGAHRKESGNVKVQVPESAIMSDIYRYGKREGDRRGEKRKGEAVSNIF